ncbi:helix-turn-helix transcriptional regulator [Mesorhizobium sp. M0816]|uniref:helix-turn-helix transcriptional regulator n=1 Tax=Mesorhizobium sp. M0816 TaxID=2957006 RepID=UPI00333D2AFE
MPGDKVDTMVKMGGWLAAVYDEERVALISGAVAEAIDAAAFGNASWDAVPRVLGEAFPGSMCSLLSHNVAEKRLNFQAVHNIEAEYLKSYAGYYASLNPWIPLWQAVESGRVLVAEKNCPARLFANTEFYNDWLRPQKDIEAAVGIKIDGGPREVIHLPLHYSLSRTGTYDQAAAEVLTRIRGNLLRSVDLGRFLRKQTEEAVAGAAVVDRACCAAFVIDGDRHLRDANQQAVDLFSLGSVAALRHGGVCIADTGADGLFRSTVAALSRGLPTDRSRINLSNSAGNWQVSLAALPTVSRGVSGVSVLFLTRALVLVLVRDLNAHPRNSVDVSALSAQFGLTPAEILLCARLGKGNSLAEAAEILGIKVETARDRVKAIFQKTGTHRQGELVAMLGTMSLVWGA